MTHLVRFPAVVAAAACLAAMTAMAGCSDRESEMAASQARLWIPEAAIRAFPLGAGVTPARIQGSAAREAITVLDEPSTTKEPSFFFCWTCSGPSVDQAVLAKSMDGHFYSAHYVWKFDPIMEDCVRSPGLCSHFTGVRTLSEDEAKTLLKQSAQYSPALYRDFFGAWPVRGANA